MSDHATSLVSAAGPKRRFGKDTIIYAAIAQAVVLLIAVFVVVVRPMLRSEPEFTAGPTIHLPQRELEHRAAMAELQQAVGGAPPLEKLVTSALLPPGLPALPAVPRTDFSAAEPADFLSRDAQALLAQSGLAGAVTGLKSVASTAAFFGVEAEGERIVVVVKTGAIWLRLRVPAVCILLLTLLAPRL